MMASKSFGVMNMYFCFTERRTQAVFARSANSMRTGCIAVSVYCSGLVRQVCHTGSSTRTAVNTDSVTSIAVTNQVCVVVTRNELTH